MPSPATPEPDLTRLREVFNAHREAGGMSYDDLAALSGVGRRTLLNIATGTYNGDLRTWLLLARAFGVSLDELLAPVWGGQPGST